MLVGLIQVALGLVLALGASQWATWAQKYNPDVLVRYTPIVAYRVAFRVAGAIFILLGLLSLLGLFVYR